jgi:hypothetical protein
MWQSEGCVDRCDFLRRAGASRLRDRPNPELMIIRTKRLDLVPVESIDAHAALNGERRPDWAKDYPTKGDLVIARLISETLVMRAVRSVQDRLARTGSGDWWMRIPWTAGCNGLGRDRLWVGAIATRQGHRHRGCERTNRRGVEGSGRKTGLSVHGQRQRAVPGCAAPSWIPAG